MEKITVGLLTIFLAGILLITGCSIFGKKKELKPFVSEVIHPEWSKNAVVYEVNVRQYTDEGTFRAFEEHLPRLKNLGIDVLWLMPTYPIGIVNRKGELGSYYSVKDFMDVNPEFGTMEDLKSVIDKTHELGMYVMLDWVPNHTAWDNRLTIDHPEFYVKDSRGKFTPPIGTDWTDVIQLDWSSEGLHDYMISAMSFWVKMGVDGFRVDHPHNTPVEFWERARAELNKIKPVLMLAEHEEPGGFLVKGFDMNYAWEMHHLMNRVAQGKDSANAVSKYFNREWVVYPQNVYRLMFLTNHDENSWAGTVDSLMGDAQKVFASLIFTASSVPLLYSGQEACLDKKLRFFTRDTIEWDTCDLTGFYASLIRLKKENRALWNGEWGGPMEKIKTNRDKKVFAFYREKEGNRVVVFLNLTRKSVAFKTILKDIGGEYSEYFTGIKEILPPRTSLKLDPWGYRVYVK
ncbi:MAG: alpha-amylase [Bacteroidales bacterium]|nr:alpha-amylase [Bacteroidales bacterium]